MIAQHSSPRADSAPPAWTRYFALVVSGISQVIPLLAGGYLVSTAGIGAGTRPFSAERLMAGLAFLCSAGTMLDMVRRRWRDGGHIGGSRALLASIALLVIGLIVLAP